MNKTKTILAAVGGATLVAVAAAGYYAWSAQSAKTAALEGDDEGTVGLESVRDRAERLVRKPVYPGAESVKALTEAREEYVAWRDEAFALAARGDRKIAPTTDAAFKDFIVNDAKRLRALPAGEDKKTLSENFEFGPFKPYIAEGKMPEQASLRELQRKWDDVATIIETLSASGVDAVTAIEVKSAVKEEPKEEDAKAKKAKAKRAKAKAKAEAAALQPLAFTYVVTCKTRPAAFAKALNALASGDRFMTVTDMTVRREKDAVAEGLGAEKKDESAQQTGGRRRRRRDAAEAEAAPKAKVQEAELFTVVADPATEQPFESRLTITVYDFRSSEEEKKEEGEEDK